MGTRRILIADDSPIEVELIRKTLAALSGTEVVAVEDGPTALRECKRSRYDVVLCDYEMPGLNGLQVVRLLRSIWSRLELPVLMLTVRDDVQTKVLALRQGANDYVTKPVEAEELLARVQAQLDLKGAVEASIEARVRMLEGRKLATIGRLAAGLAHDLNTPAQFSADNLVFLQKAVSLSTELLSRTRDWLVDRPPADASFAEEFLQFWQQKRLSYLVGEAPKALGEALNGVLRMARIVRELKEFAGLPEASWAPADINRALENTVAVSRQVWSAVADVSLELERDLAPVACDVSALKLAFFDILMAALERATKATPVLRAAGVRGAPPARAAALHLQISTRRVEQGIEIQFRDDGTGLPAELQREFEPSGASHELLERLEAHGLGAAYAVLAQHQGSLRGESAPGQGAIWTVRLREGVPSPRAHEPLAAAVPASARS